VLCSVWLLDARRRILDAAALGRCALWGVAVLAWCTYVCMYAYVKIRRHQHTRAHRPAVRGTCVAFAGVGEGCRGGLGGSKIHEHAVSRCEDCCRPGKVAARLALGRTGWCCGCGTPGRALVANLGLVGRGGLAPPKRRASHGTL